MVGAGLAGLAAALSLSRDGRRVALHEAAGHAGGRCRSYLDTQLGCRIDNGNHLLLSANRAAIDYLDEIGARGSLQSAAAAFPFHDLVSGTRWTVRPAEPRLWQRLTAPIRQVPGARAVDALGVLRLAMARRHSTVMEALGPGALMERFWRPLTAAVLNAEPEVASARLLRAVMREVLATGEAVPLTAREGLSESFVDPALETLGQRGVSIGFGRRLRSMQFGADRVTALIFGEETMELPPADSVILAVTPQSATALVPGLTVPEASSAILNAHFRLDRPGRLPDGAGLIGLTGGLSHWLFLRGAIASVTVSAADALLDRTGDDLAARIWREIAPVLGLPTEPQPPARIVKEKRATFRQDPASLARRPPARTMWRNLTLAGDWTDTGLPATLEGAIRSGRKAAAVLGAEVFS